ncbi:MAG: DUF4352 domain-containing protein [Armatimonadota bacterium]|nr:DUF4352 domain-containing protein [Armatimonadota bacterium]
MTMTSRVLVCVGLLVGLVAHLVHPATDPILAAPAEAGVIVPGQSLGLLRLGAPVGLVYQMPGWGQPDRVHASGSISYMYYGRQGVTVAVRDSAVVLILTTSERFRTDKGVAVGQATSAVSGAYGAPAVGGDGRTLWFDAVGLVAVTGGGTIVRLGVYDPKNFVRVILAEEYPARDVFLSARSPRFETAARADAAAGGPVRTAIIAVTLKNTSRGLKILNPNFFAITDDAGQTHRYDKSTFSQPGACRSTVSVQPGESKSCSLVFVLPAGKTVRSLVYNDGGSLDEFFF